MESLPEPVGDEVYSDHPQDCSLDISKVSLCRLAILIEALKCTVFHGLWWSKTRGWKQAKWQGRDKFFDKTF